MSWAITHSPEAADAGLQKSTGNRSANTTKNMTCFLIKFFTPSVFLFPKAFCFLPYSIRQICGKSCLFLSNPVHFSENYFRFQNFSWLYSVLLYNRESIYNKFEMDKAWSLLFWKDYWRDDKQDQEKNLGVEKMKKVLITILIILLVALIGTGGYILNLLDRIPKASRFNI